MTTVEISTRTYPRTYRSDLVVTAGSTIVAATLSVDNARSGASVTSLKVGSVEINYLRRCPNCRASCELSCKNGHDVLNKHFECEIGS